MHRTIILWIASFILTFLAGYIYNITDRTYPVSGTIGIEGYKVSYMFDKAHYGIDPYRIILRTDISDVKGKVKWRFTDEKDDWYESVLTSEEKILKGKIPFSSDLKEVEYKVELNHKDKEYHLAGGNSVKLKFYSKVPSPVKFFNSFLIYLILFLSIRTGLEYFNADQKIKKYSFITAVVALLFTAMIHPLYLSYKYGYINHSIPPVENLFPLYSILFLAVWVIFTIIHFKAKNPKPFAGAAGILTIAIYLLVRF